MSGPAPLERWLEMLNSDEAPHEYHLELQPGDRLAAAPPYPDLEVQRVETTYVRRLVMQTVVARASAAEEGRGTADVVVARLVAELEGGGEVEVTRMVAPAESSAAVAADPNRCAACGRSIIPGEAITISGGSYHRTCVY